jgi:subtilisin family serine protease
LDETLYSACDFGNSDHNPEDAAFTCNNKLIGARQIMAFYQLVFGLVPDEFDSARDENGHGTHTASTAAGNAGVPASILGRDLGVVSGIAPRAHIIAYKVIGWRNRAFFSDLTAAIDQAVADGVDVINYSINGSKPWVDPVGVAFLFAASSGVFVANSNGNWGPGPFSVGSPATVPWLTSVGASTQDRTYQGSVSSVDGWEFFGGSVTAGTPELPLVDAADAGDELCTPGALDPTVVAGKIVLCLRGDREWLRKSLEVSSAGGAGMILYDADDETPLLTHTHYVPSVYIHNTDGLFIKDYIANTADPRARINAGEFTPQDAPYMARFSSRGPNRLSLDIIKPDVTAPGVNVLAGISPFHLHPVRPLGELFAFFNGTSMSSPHVAGLFALLKQAHPDWTAAMAKSALMTTAYQAVNKEDNATPADPFDIGAGHVNPGGKANKGSAFEPGLAYDAGLLEYTAFTCGRGLNIFPPDRCAFVESLGVPSEARNLNLASIGIGNLAGSETILRTVTSVAREQGWRTFTVDVDPPPGYEVSVSPSSISLKQGMSATYEVTITNAGAPGGEWRFGSLIWSDSNGHYSVRSPIAVRGSLTGASGLVSGP